MCYISIKLLHFPKDGKVAQLEPLYKKGIKPDPKPCRSISLLPIVSIFIEKVILNQMNYLVQNNFLCRPICILQEPFNR